jgi:hypothetical protein
MAYELQSYQNHPDYTRTLSCCKQAPKPALVMRERVKRYILVELIGLNTLVDWIDANAFNLDINTQNLERDKAFAATEELMELVERKEQVKYSDIKRFMGRSANMLSAFLHRYEPEPKPVFPAYQGNLGFVSTWDCHLVNTKADHYPLGQYRIYADPNS